MREFAFYIATIIFVSIFHTLTVSGSSGCTPNIPVLPFHYVLRKHYVLLWRLMNLKTTYKDGDRFWNRERCLPEGCYKKFTLLYDKRGPSRLVVSCDGDDIYYSFDHYSSFTKIIGFKLGGHHPLSFSGVLPVRGDNIQLYTSFIITYYLGYIIVKI